MRNGYNFYFDDNGDVLTFPITPPSLNITVGSKNEVVTLINEGDVNILKSPGLIEVSFEARFPMRQYPYARTYSSFQNYFDKFKELKEKKKPFHFIVVRDSLGGKRSWDTDLYMALEDFTLKEDAGEGDDVLISFNLKQYKNYGIVKLKTPTTTSATTTSTSSKPRETKAPAAETYTIKSGDTLWAIAKKKYGNGAEYTKIYNANKSVIEAEAKKHGKSSSSNGHWIYPGCKITIPAK